MITPPARTWAKGVITKKVADEALTALEIDHLGLDAIDHRMLRSIMENKAVVLFLSAWLDIPRSSISLLRGESSRLKVVELPDGCEGKLARLLSAEDVSGA